MRPRVIIGILIVVLVVGGLGFGGFKVYQRVDELFTPERCYYTVDPEEVQTLTAEQATNASIIVAASYEAGLPEQAAVIALTTAWQESGLRNLDHGDRDSLGLFQQRPSYGWGTEEEIMDPWYSSLRFYEELVKFDDWEGQDITEMAQKVQRSGFPDAYRKHETKAIALTGSLRGTRPASLACIDRKDKHGDAEVFARVVDQVPGVAVSQERGAVMLAADEEEDLWAATQLALANTRQGGIVEATLPDHTWKQGMQSWKNTPGSGERGQAVIRLNES